jgi:hypothetical protein
MSAIPMDTYKIVKRLREAGFTDVQAETVTDVLRGGRDADLSQVATKADLTSLKSELKAELAEVKADLFKWSLPLLLGQAALIAALVKLL